MDIKRETEKRCAEIELILEEYLPEQTGFQETVSDAMNYSVTAGGKRLRPMLMNETYKMFGGTSKVIEPFMAAMEMIHTYSLVHDDLPAMDNDEYRRGKKTTHAVYGEDIAILAGDALLNYAMETALKAYDLEPDNSRFSTALKILFRKSGIYGMVGGQTVDILTDNGQEITREKLNFIYKLKTGALIEASMMIGAVLAGAEEEQIKIVEDAAANAGLAFQIQDDILDITSTLEELGKPIGSDEKNAKATYVTFEGLKKSEEDVKCLSREAVEKIRGLHLEDTFVTELLMSLVNRRK